MLEVPIPNDFSNFTLSANKNTVLSISPGYCRYFSIGSEYGRKGGECLHSLKILSILNTQFCNLIFLLKLIFHDFLAAATTFDRFLLMTGCSLHRYMLLLPLAVAVGLLLSEKCYPLNTSVATVTLGRKKMCCSSFLSHPTHTVKPIFFPFKD